MLTHDQLLADVEELDVRLEGEAIGPHDPRFDGARLAWNLAVDQRPAAVAVVRTAADVVAVIDFARTHGLRVAAQGTGHNASALGALDATLLIKTHAMRGVEVDPVARRVRVEAGAVWLDVTKETAPHGLVPPLGSSPDVGVIGYTLGGGYCWVGRKHGLASNNVTAIEVVLADGSQVRATADNEPDLFWALRGGGGSFGVVTAIELELFDEPNIFAASMLFPSERGAEVLHTWRASLDGMGEETTSYARFFNFPPIPDIPEPMRGRSFVNVEVVHLGDHAAGRAASDAIRALGPEIELGGMLDAEQLNHFHMDPEQPVPGVGGAHMILEDLTPEAIDTLVAVAGSTSRSPLVMFGVRHLEGALGREPEGAGALAKLDGKFATYGVGMAIDGDAAVAIESHLEKVMAAMAPWDRGSRLMNFVEHPADTRPMFPSATYQRLQAIRAAVDPDELFQSNHPIRVAR